MIQGTKNQQRQGEKRDGKEGVVTEKVRKRRAVGGGRGEEVVGRTHMLWSTHQPQWGSPEPRHSLQLRY